MVVTCLNPKVVCSIKFGPVYFLQIDCTKSKSVEHCFNDGVNVVHYVKMSQSYTGSER